MSSKRASRRGRSSSVSLLHSTSEVNAVSWSQDQRVAVTASQAIYILTLKRPRLSSKLDNAPTPSKKGSTSAPHTPDEGHPPLVINTALAPSKESLVPLSLGGVEETSYRGVTTYPEKSQWSMVDFVDPLMDKEDKEGAMQSCDLFKASYWSPAGYSHLGGCVLTALTASGRLLLFTPPGNTGNFWKLALDISSHHAQLLLKSYPEAAPSRSATPPEPAKKKSGKTPGRKKKGSSSDATPIVGGQSSEVDAMGLGAETGPPTSKRAKLDKASSDQEAASTNGRNSPGGSPKLAEEDSKTGSIADSVKGGSSTKENPEESTSRSSKRRGASKSDDTSSKRPKPDSKTWLSEEYKARRLAVACTACAWLPTLLQVNCEVIGVIAMTTRTGRVTLLGVKLPIVLGETKQDPLFLISEHQLPLTGKDEYASWGCSLRWLPSPTVWGTKPTFYMNPAPGTEGRVHAQLAVGCTNGQVFILQWELSGANGVVGLVSNSINSVNGVTGVCSITGVSGGVSGCVSGVTGVWEEADGVPVYSIACQPKFSDSGSLWISFSKSNLLIAQLLDSSYKNKEKHVKISGHHKMTITGIAALPDSSFISSALDGTVQTCSLQSSTSQATLTPTPVHMEGGGGGKGGGAKEVRAQGVAVSEMGIFAAVAVSLPDRGLAISTFARKVRAHASLHFLTLSSPAQVQTLLKTDAAGRWDVGEYLRKSHVLNQGLLPPVQEMLTQLYVRSKGKVFAASKIPLLLQASIITGKDEAIGQCREQIVRKHVCSCLKSWLDWEKGVWLTHRATWLLSCEKNCSPTETKLANKVLSTLPPSPSSSPTRKTSSSSRQPPLSPAPALEVCEACGLPVPLSSLERGVCPRGHMWSRCSLTLCLASDARCSSCIQCGAIVNNALTLSSSQGASLTGSWLNSLLQAHTSCIFCGGYFEQVI